MFMYLGYRGKVNAKTETDYEKILKKEMTVYEVEGVKGKHISLIYSYLMAIRPTS